MNHVVIQLASCSSHTFPVFTFLRTGKASLCLKWMEAKASKLTWTFRLTQLHCHILLAKNVRYLVRFKRTLLVHLFTHSANICWASMMFRTPETPRWMIHYPVIKVRGWGPEWDTGVILPCKSHRLPPDYSLNSLSLQPLLMCSCPSLFLHCPFTNFCPSSHS